MGTAPEKPLSGFVLIVPYGIETKKENNGKSNNNVLIVPYGIETGDMGEPTAGREPC